MKYVIAFGLALSIHLGIIYTLSLTSEPEIRIKGGAVQVDFISPVVSEAGNPGSETDVVSEDLTEPSEPAPAEAEVRPMPPEPPAEAAIEPEPIAEPEPLPEPDFLPEPEPTPSVESTPPTPQPEQPQPVTPTEIASDVQENTAPSDRDDAAKEPVETVTDAQSAPSQPGTQAASDQGAQSSTRGSDVAQEIGNSEEDDYRGEVLRHLSRARPITGDKRDSAVIAFTILPSGELENLRISRSSGKKRFDRAALKSIERVAPVPLPPNGQSFDFNILIESN
ncbi:MAG: cell envelope integrity protein TolA [Pseudomonadota bacterium]